MAPPRHLLLLLAAAVSALPTDENKHLRCYTCSSDHNPSCDDPFNSTGIQVVDCLRKEYRAAHELEVAVCKKVKQRINNGDLQTVRSCAFVRSDQPCTTTHQSSYIHEEYCITCGQDLCNDGHATSAVLAAAVLSALLARVLA